MDDADPVELASALVAAAADTSLTISPFSRERGAGPLGVLERLRKTPGLRVVVREPLEVFSRRADEGASTATVLRMPLAVATLAR